MIQASLCAPLRAGEMNGPSTCTPSTRAPTGKSGINAAAWRSASPSTPSGAVMNVGTSAVAPVCGSLVTTLAQPSASAVWNSSP